MFILYEGFARSDFLKGPRSKTPPPPERVFGLSERSKVQRGGGEIDVVMTLTHVMAIPRGLGGNMPSY